MNFIQTYIKGQEGLNTGLYMGDGLKNLHNKLNGLQKGFLYTLAAAPKVGKSTLLNYGFIINPLLDAIEKKKNIKYYYFSLEMNRIDQEFMFATYFLHKHFNIREIQINTFKNGENIITLSPEYLRGRLVDDNNELIKVSDDIFEKLKFVYKEYIIPFFGEYDENNNKLSDGYIEVIEISNNPTGIYYFILEEAKKRGEFVYKKFGESQRIVNYLPKDTEEIVVICFDHVRKIFRERGLDLKGAIDELARYFVELRNILQYTFVVVQHLNRSLTDVQRLKMFGDTLYPDSDMLKDSGNFVEESNVVITMFNPNDDRYNLKKHFGIQIRDSYGNIIHPELKTIHIVEHRSGGSAPLHFRTKMLGDVKSFNLFTEI
jgi:hypothetical protein